MGQAVPFFAGWLGYGSSFRSLQIVEPTDPSYARRSITYEPLSGAEVIDDSTGSIGPAGVSWNGLCYAGLYDAQMAGNLIAAMRLPRPVNVPAGGTVTESGRFSFTLTQSGGTAWAVTSWVAGSALGLTRDGSIVAACANLQLLDGSLQVIGGLTTGIQLSALPLVAPATGSGMLWNNGGVICIA